MARTVVAIYDGFQAANEAVRDLVDSGFSRENISIIASNSRGEGGTQSTTRASTEGTVADETGAGAGVGAGIGAAIGGIGGLLVGLGALVIPGIGPVLAAGPLAVALSTLTGAGVGAVAGGVTGGLLGALIGLGVPEEQAEYYAEGVRRGGVLVTVQADEYNSEQITSILNRHNPIDIQGQAQQWRQQGWSGYDPNQKPLTAEELERERAQWQIANTGYTDPTAQTMRTPVASEAGDLLDSDDRYYQQHYQSTFAQSGNPFEYYAPAYRYGYQLRSNPRFEGMDWPHIETEVRYDWERQHPGTWERVRNAIRYAWEEIRH